MDMVRKLILEKLTERGLRRKEASLAMGQNDTYLSQFLRRGIPTELPEAPRISLAKLLGVDESELRGPTTKVARQNEAADKFKLEMESAPDYAPNGNSPNITPGSELFGNVDLPVYGTAAGSIAASGAIVTKQAVDWTVRPPSLLRVQDGYGLIVPDNTMSPEHRVGSIALVNPHLPPKIDESCVLRCVSGEGVEIVLIREYRGETDTHWKVAQHNPPKLFSLKKSAWTCQKTVGNYNS